MKKLTPTERVSFRLNDRKPSDYGTRSGPSPFLMSAKFYRWPNMIVGVEKTVVHRKQLDKTTALLTFMDSRFTFEGPDEDVYLHIVRAKDA